MAISRGWILRAMCCGDIHATEIARGFMNASKFIAIHSADPFKRHE
jgi:hypothetical protein